MFKSVLDFLDNVKEDSLLKRINKEPIAPKYWFNLGGAIACTVGMVVIIVFIMLSNRNPPLKPTFAYTDKELIPIITLPYPTQSMKNVQAWLVDAIMASYSFSFSKYREQVAGAEYYFTPAGYQTYLQSLALNKMEESVVLNSLQISIVPTKDPVWINGGAFGQGEFWRFRVPVLVSYYGGKEVVNEKYMVETLIIRVPSHENHRGLGIAEFNMLPQ